MISSKITLTKERKGKEKKKGRGGRKEEKRKKQLLHYYFFYNGYFADSFWPEKKLLNGKGPFGGNVFKNPARRS